MKSLWVGGLLSISDALDGCGKNINGNRKKLMQPIIWNRIVYF